MEVKQLDCFGAWLDTLRNHIQESPCYSSSSGFLRTVCENIVSSSSPESYKSVLDEFDMSAVDTQPASFLDGWILAKTLKKFRYGCLMDPADAIKGWVERNDVVTHHRLRWDVRCEMKRLLTHVLAHYDRGSGRFGPGSTSEGARDLLAKVAYLAPSSYTYPIGDELFEAPVTSAARLCAVPKTVDKLRLITVEPIVQTWCQQAVRHGLLAAIHAGPLRGSVMDLSGARFVAGLHSSVSSLDPLSDPVQKQRRRVLLGARHGHLATLDFSNASDCISWQDVVDVFPPAVVADLEKVRSFQYETPDSGVGAINMYAGMGNATTFVVETLYFWALLTALAELAHVGFADVSVFGDDVVMRTKAATHPWVQSMIGEAGLNLSKGKCGTSAGPGFREGCGIVAFGDDFISFTPSIHGSDGSVESLCGLAALQRALVTDCSVSHRESTAIVLSTLLERVRPYVSVTLPQGDNRYGGLYFYARGTHLAAPLGCRIRWNTALQRAEARVRTLEIKTREVRLAPCKWGPGVRRSWAYWLYQCSLAGLLGSESFLFKGRDAHPYLTQPLRGACKLRTTWIPM